MKIFHLVRNTMHGVSYANYEINLFKSNNSRNTMHVVSVYWGKQIPLAVEKMKAA